MKQAEASIQRACPIHPDKNLCKRIENDLDNMTLEGRPEVDYTPLTFTKSQPVHEQSFKSGACPSLAKVSRDLTDAI